MYIVYCFESAPVYLRCLNCLIGASLCTIQIQITSVPTHTVATFKHKCKMTANASCIPIFFCRTKVGRTSTIDQENKAVGLPVAENGVIWKINLLQILLDFIYLLLVKMLQLIMKDIFIFRVTFVISDSPKYVKKQ